MVAYMKEGRLNIKEGEADTYRWRMDGCKEREKTKEGWLAVYMKEDRLGVKEGG